MNEAIISVIIFYGTISFLANIVYFLFVGGEYEDDESFFTVGKYYYKMALDFLSDYMNKTGVVIAMIAFQLFMLAGQIAFFAMIYLVCFPLFLFGKLFFKIFDKREK